MQAALVATNPSLSEDDKALTTFLDLLRALFRGALSVVATYQGGDTERYYTVVRHGNSTNIRMEMGPPTAQLLANIFEELQNSEIAAALFRAIEMSPLLRRHFLSQINGESNLLEGQRAVDQFWLRVRGIAAHYVAATNGSRDWSPHDFDGIQRRLAYEIRKSTATRLRSIFLINMKIEESQQIGPNVLIRPYTDREVSGRLNEAFTFRYHIDPQSLLHTTAVVEQRAEVERHLLHNFAFDDIADRVAAAARIVSHGDPGILSVEDSIESLCDLGFWGPIRPPELSATTRPQVAFTSADIIRLADIIRMTQESANKRIVETAWRRLNFGSARDRSEDALLDFVIGIEAVLNSEKGSEITRRIGQRLAGLVGIDAEREAIYSNMAKLYKARSEVAHGTSLKNVVEQAQQAREYLERLIVAVLRLSKPLDMNDLDHALLRGLGANSYSNGP